MQNCKYLIIKSGAAKMHACAESSLRNDRKQGKAVKALPCLRFSQFAEIRKMELGTLLGTHYLSKMKTEIISESALSQRELYKLTKEMLYAKFDGLCALCGCELGNTWHIWHIEPNKTIVTKTAVIIANNTYENKLPSCISCNSTRNNHCKHGTIEDFRKALYWEFYFMKHHMMYSTIYQKMLRYHLVEETGNSITFHFEKLT